MTTMLDCIERVPSLLEKIVDGAGETFREAVEAAEKRGVNELYFIGSGTSFTGAQTARYLAEEASGLRVIAALPEDFLYGHTVRNPDALYAFISQTGTSTAAMEALKYCRERGFLTVGISESPDTPIARAADVFLDMGCGREEYGMRTIGYSTTVMTLMWLGILIGERRGRVSKERYGQYERQAKAAAANIPEVIRLAGRWMDKSRRRMMKSSFLSFTGTASLTGVAMEAAVKVWEAPQIPSAGYELDEGMHGPNYGYNYNCAVFVLNDGGFGNDRALSLARYMKREHDNGYVIGVGAMDEKDLAFAPAGGPFESLEFAAAVQVLMYRLAVDGGRDFSVLGVHAKMNSYFQSHSEKLTAGERENG